MFLQLNHQKLDAFQFSFQLVHECYKLTADFPFEEKFGLTQQIRSAALSVHLNIAEGSSRKSQTERKRFYEVARGSVIEIDAALDIVTGIAYKTKESMEKPGEYLLTCFKILSGLITAGN